MSKVTVLGGCGTIGSVAVRTLAAGDVFSEIVIAEGRYEQACALAQKINPSRIAVLEVNADDPESIKRVVSGSSVVLNCVGPFYRYGATILKAVIEAGINYVDVCDDLDATLRELELDEAARKAGVSALMGMGTSPGLGNVMVRFCAEQLLSQVDAVDIYHIHGGEAAEGPAVIEHRFHSMESDIPMFLDGQFMQVRMLEPSGMALAEETDFRGIGTYPVYPYPHPETITLPRYLKGIRRVTNLGSVLPIEYFHKIMDVIRLGLGSEEKLLVRGQEVSMRQFAVAFVLAQREKLLQKTALGGPSGCLKVQVQGHKNSQAHTYIFSITSRTGGVGEGTGIPAAIGAMLMERGRIDRKGVFPPEAAVDPLEALKMTGKVFARIAPAGQLPFVLEHIGPAGQREDLDLTHWL